MDNKHSNDSAVSNEQEEIIVDTPVSASDTAVSVSCTDGSPSDFLDTGHLESDLKGRAVRGGAATLGGQFARQVIRIGSVTILARLLTPADFGLIAMITAVTGFVTLFKDMGLSMATVQREKVTHDQISTLFWINVALSLVVVLVIVALAPAIAWFYGQPRLLWLTLGLSVGLIFSGLTVQHQALLRRQMRFGRLAVVQVFSMACGVIVAILTAFAGAGVWSLVCMQIGQAVSATLGIWLACPWRPGSPRRNTGVGNMLKFGGNLTGFTIVNYHARNLDNVLIGRVCGGAALGSYSKAYGLMMLPIQQMTSPIGAVAVPTLSKLQTDPERFRRFYLKAIFLTAFVTMPVMAFLTTQAANFVMFILGPQWKSAIELFMILGVCSLIQPIYSTLGWLHVSLGRTDRMFRWGVVGSCAIVSSFLIGLPFGANGVAIGYAAVMHVILIPALWYAGRPAHFTVMCFVRAIYRPFVVSWCAAMLSRYLANQLFSDTLSVFVAATLLMVTIYFLLICLAYGGLGPFKEFLAILKPLRSVNARS